MKILIDTENKTLELFSSIKPKELTVWLNEHPEYWDYDLIPCQEEEVTPHIIQYPAPTFWKDDWNTVTVTKTP